MNYAYQYFKIIAHRVEHPLNRSHDGSVECHHIIPKSEGGKDTTDNLVNLSSREHYICHLLLAKIYDDLKMWSAVIYMRTGSLKGRSNVKFNSHLYQKARENFGRKSS